VEQGDSYHVAGQLPWRVRSYLRVAKGAVPLDDIYGGSICLQDLTKSRLETLRAKLLGQRTRRGTKRTVKAIRNIIDWHLRTLWRDAEREGLVGSFPKLTGRESNAQNRIRSNLKSGTASSVGFSNTNHTGIHGSIFSSGRACGMAKRLRCALAISI
jgi:hypothetical protein